MSESQQTISIQELEANIERAFAGLWGQGVLGVKVSIHDEEHFVRIRVYILSDAQLENLDTAVRGIESGFGGSYTFEEQVVHGVVPAAKIMTSFVA
ncbi:MAG TPA: hypothetical protein VK171_11855 [Fimbriimonas sp.]|nr:hypothetical protein [Fimbriimonas sp.]